jgi:hypothetical protein
MLKYLIPFLFATTIAYGQDVPHDKLHNHFDPLANSWDGSLSTVSPVIANLAPLAAPTPEMGHKCTTDDLKTVSAYFRSFGYTALLVADDKSRDNVRDELMYNINDNSVLSLSLFFDKPLSSDDNKLIKICTEFQGVKVEGDGPTFKKFVLGQHMAEMNEALDRIDQHHRDLASGKEGEEHREPYQGDPSRIGYNPLP